MSSALSFDELRPLLSGRSVADVICPACTPGRQRKHQKEAKLRLWALDHAISFYCAHCEEQGIAFEGGAERRIDPAELERVRRERDAEHQKLVRDRRRLANWLYGKAVPVKDTKGEVYWRLKRGISAPLPHDMRFLPRDGKHPASILLPFRSLGGEILGIHLTKLKADGSKLDKIMIGKEFGGCPLVMAPIAGNGLVVAEGPENALTLHEVTGLGAWAAGAKGLLLDLAPSVPGGVETWVWPDMDADGGGVKAAMQLVTALRAKGQRANLVRPDDV